MSVTVDPDNSNMPPLTPAQAEMVAANTGLVWFAIHRNPTLRDQDKDDAFQNGVMGLMRAVQKFDPDRGVRFSTYAMNWIRQSIARGIEVQQGSNYRRALRFGLPYIAPLSLDAERNDDGDATLADVLADDTEPRSTIVDPRIEAVEAAARTLRLTYLIDGLANGLSRAEIGRQHGVSREIIRRRVQKLADFVGGVAS